MGGRRKDPNADREYYKAWAARKKQDPEWVARKQEQQRVYKAEELADPVRGQRRREIQRARHINRSQEDLEYKARKRQQEREHWQRTKQKLNDDPEYRGAITLRNRCYRVGITVEEYQEVWEAQAGLCGICHLPERHVWQGKVKELALDHCHSSGKFRALLCHDCNTMLGMAKDKPEVLRAAATYLESHNT